MRRKASRRPQRHRGMHAEDARLVRGGRHDTPSSGVATDDNRLADERRIQRLLHRDKEGIEVYVKDVPRHRGSEIANMF